MALLQAYTPRAGTAAVVAAVVLAAASLPRPVAADGQCSQVPYVKGVDQSPTDPSNYGRCTSAIEGQFLAYSHWCKAGRIGAWPDEPNNKAKKCLKFGRATIYRGPIYGSSTQHKAACNKVMRGDDDAAMVAVSTKYLKTYQGGWAGDKGACDACMCVRLHGVDDNFNRGVQHENVKPRLGLTFLARVGDRCSECDDDHIDILQDRPFSFAPFNPDAPNDNYYAPYANAKDGVRGFSDPESMRPNARAPETAGSWTALWQFVPCGGFSHARCAALMRGADYGNTWTPPRTAGVDSFSLRPVSQLRGAHSDRLFKEPHGGR